MSSVFSMCPSSGTTANKLASSSVSWFFKFWKFITQEGLSQRQSQKKLGNIAEICKFISLASFSKEVEKEMAPHSGTLAWKIPWTEEPTYSPWGRQESDTTERLHFHFSLSCTGEGNGDPLQYSCLENPRDGGAWWAAVYGIAQSWTRLKRLSMDICQRDILSSSHPPLPPLCPGASSWNRLCSYTASFPSWI